MFWVGGGDGEIIVWNNSTENVIRKLYKNTQQQNSSSKFVFLIN